MGKKKKKNGSTAWSKERNQRHAEMMRRYWDKRKAKMKRKSNYIRVVLKGQVLWNKKKKWCYNILSQFLNSFMFRILDWHFNIWLKIQFYIFSFIHQFSILSQKKVSQICGKMVIGENWKNTKNIWNYNFVCV